MCASVQARQLQPITTHRKSMVGCMEEDGAGDAVVGLFDVHWDDGPSVALSARADGDMCSVIRQAENNSTMTCCWEIKHEAV